MKVFLAICIVGLSLLAGCGGGPTAPKAVSAPPFSEITPIPTPAPQPCRPVRNCLE